MRNRIAKPDRSAPGSHALAAGSRRKTRKVRTKSAARLALHLHMQREMLTEVTACPAQPQRRSETILVVDDNASVLKAVVEILKNAHFQGAFGGRWCRRGRTGEQNGRTSRPASNRRRHALGVRPGPGIKAEENQTGPARDVDVGGENGNLLVLNYGWAFLQKPFVSAKLVQMITEVLDSPDRSQLGGQKFDSRKDTR